MILKHFFSYKSWLCLFVFYILIVFGVKLQAQDDENLEEGFEDPFQNKPAEQMKPEESIGQQAPPDPSEAPSGSSLPSESHELPKFEEPQLEKPLQNSIPTPTEGLAPAPSNLPPEPKKNFAFPEFGTGEGPISQTFIEKRQRQESTAEGTWILSASGGGAINLNQSYNQAELDLNLGYRLSYPWEIYLTTYYRFVRTKLLGILLSARYQVRLTDPKSFRLEWAPSLGIGYTLRAKKTSFNQSQLPIRAQTEFLFYASPEFAVTASVGIEAFYLRFSDNKAKSLLSKMPTQAVGLAGIRFEF